MSVVDKNRPILLINASGDQNSTVQECTAFLGQHWSAGVEIWPDTPSHPAAAIVLCGSKDLKNGQARCLRLLISWRVPVLVINTSGRHNYSWANLATRNNRVKYAVADGKAWYDVCFHFLHSLKQSLEANDFRLLATSLNERQQL